MLDCGKVEEFYNENIENLQNQVATNLGFEIEDHSLKLYVRCKKKSCNKKSLILKIFNQTFFSMV